MVVGGSWLVIDRIGNNNRQPETNNQSLISASVALSAVAVNLFPHGSV
jgi:hypothetical protein